MGSKWQVSPCDERPILGGLWGTQKTQNSKKVWNDIWTNIIADPLSKSNRSKYGPDMTLLGRHVWGKVPGGMLQHDSFFCAELPDGSKGFPSQRPNSSGNVAGVSPWRRQDNIECPTQCRRKKTWHSVSFTAAFKSTWHESLLSCCYSINETCEMCQKRTWKTLPEAQRTQALLL